MLTLSHNGQLYQEIGIYTSQPKKGCKRNATSAGIQSKKGRFESGGIISKKRQRFSFSLIHLNLLYFLLDLFRRILNSCIIEDRRIQLSIRMTKLIQAFPYTSNLHPYPAEVFISAQNNNSDTQNELLDIPIFVQDVLNVIQDILNETLDVREEILDIRNEIPDVREENLHIQNVVLDVQNELQDVPNVLSNIGNVIRGMRDEMLYIPEQLPNMHNRLSDKD